MVGKKQMTLNITVLQVQQNWHGGGYGVQRAGFSTADELSGYSTLGTSQSVLK